MYSRAGFGPRTVVGEWFCRPDV